MKAKGVTIASLCAVAVALALPAVGVAATPTVTQVKGSDGPHGEPADSSCDTIVPALT